MSPKELFIASSVGFVLNFYENREEVSHEEFDGYLSFLNERLTDETVSGISEQNHSRNVALAATEYLEDPESDFASVPHGPLRNALAD